MNNEQGDIFEFQLQHETGYSKLALKPAEAAELVGVSLPVMYKLCKRADFPAIHLGRSIVIPRQSLEQWLTKEAGVNG